MANGTMTRPATQGAARRNGEQAPQPMRPFVAGTRRIDEPDFDQTVTLTTSSQDLNNYEVSPNGFLRGLWVLVEGTYSANSATVALQADAPFSVLSTINFQDTNSQPIVGPLTGYDLYILTKYGGYHFVDDIKNGSVYSATSGTAATGGFTIPFYLPVEIVCRDALGSLPNKSASSTFKVDMTIAASTAVYSTAPSVLPSVRVRVTEMGWQDPNATDIRNNPVAQDPPGVQTTQYWSRQTYPLVSGAFDQRLQSIDAYVRSLIFIARDENASRSQGDSEFPDPFTLQYENSLIVESRIRALWRHWVTTHWGYIGATADQANARDLGVYPLSWAQDFELKVGNETRYGYLPVSSATNLTIRGTIGGSGTNSYTVLVNKVVPAGGNPLVLTGGR